MCGILIFLFISFGVIMSKVTVTKVGEIVELNIESAGTLKLESEDATQLIKLLNGVLGIQDSKKIVKLRLPVKYLSETATEADKITYETFKSRAQDIAEKGYGAIIFPAVRDENGNPLFDLEVL
jgi:hypothetical protein